MNGEDEALLPVTNTIETTQQYDHDDADLGPSPLQNLTEEVHLNKAEYEFSGSLSHSVDYIPNEADRKILSTIKTYTTGANKNIVVDWPTFSDKPISEYSNQKVFCMLYPWLYPGGNGDYMDDQKYEVSPAEWAKHQFYLKDGRFCKDKTWNFYAVNYVQ